jgi:glycosyltransferase involved in cell wall biosynthesis
VKVLFIADCLPNGGRERQLALLATNLPPEWHRRVIALEGGPFEATLRQGGVPVEVLRRRSRLDLLPGIAIARRVLSLHPDVVHTWGWMSTAAAGPACRLAEVPLVDGTIRTGARQATHWWLKRIGMACATTIVANSRAGAIAWDAPSHKTRIIYNGFDWSRLTSVTPDPAGSRGHTDVLTVVMTARMVDAKDYDTVLKAARLLFQREGGRYLFLLVGQGPNLTPLMARAGDLMTEGVIRFSPGGLEVLDLVRQADVGVLLTDPSHAQEGCSNAIMEYMACRLPVICSEGGGNRELVEDGSTGFVIRPGDAGQLAQRLLELRSDPDGRRAMGAAGHHRIVEHFSVQRMVEDFVCVYGEAIRAARR